ncbi:hypothetical protein A7317_00750 [Pseudomonas fluorescens]|uniref:hypothetical protein n=1 Tax=Pseudomonas TaxID=286 RepID=UPI00083E67C0|nr:MULTISPECIES: hypothetical protein [Pseudomonas]AOE65564.1 hypothetical protein A7317_00750 [Pseudomonas fluorescens]AOE71384.1 hypothetical protein A7319_00770 [Pseudomonas fluorescens]WEX16138.1 hypothetical protein P2T68_02065 [Pseudomonas sp. G11]
MDFLKLVQEGVEKSNQSLAAIREVDGVFDRVNTDLRKFPAGELKVFRSVSTLSQAASLVNNLAGIDSINLKQDLVVLSLTTDIGTFSQEVAGWKQRATGYPCILKFEGQELSLSNETQLISGFGELLASVGFGNAVNKLLKLSAEAHQKQNQASGTIVSAGSEKKVIAPIKQSPVKLAAVKSTAKPNMQSNVKYAAKPLAATAAAAKPTAKPTSKLPVQSGEKKRTRKGSDKPRDAKPEAPA